MILWIGLAYLVVVSVIGAVATRRTRNAADFFLAGRAVGLVALSLSIMAGTLSGFAFIGGPGLLYSVGLGALFIILPAALTHAMSAWAVGRRLRLLGEIRNVVTLPGAIGARYRSPGAQSLAGAAILVAVLGYMATNFLALGIILDAVLGMGVTPGIWLGMGVTLAYAAGGGILAGIWTDIFQGLLMAVGSVLIFGFALEAGGGLGNISTTILAADPQFLEPWGHLSPLGAFSFYFVFALGALGQPHVVHKFFMLRDPAVLRWYPLLTTVALMATLLLFVGVGLAVKALVIQGAIPPLAEADQATPIFLLNFTPPLLAALVLAGAVAAVMSTVNSFMNVGAAALLYDLPAAWKRRSATEEGRAHSPSNASRGLGTQASHDLGLGRLYTVLLSLAAALIAQLSGTLVAFLAIFGWGLFASTLVPALAVGLNWEGATRVGALASIGTGLVVTLTGESLGYLGVYALPAGVTVSGLSLVLSFLAFFAVSYLTRASAASGLDPDIRAMMES
ncbi:MAG: hypothetical protein WEA09_06360 [Gemmatimonadota bacterium]